MDLGLAGAKAIVTGGSRGIGRAVAQTLGGEGVAVAICARGREGLDRAVTELRSHGVDVRGQVLDVSDETAIPGFVDWAARRVRRAGHQRLQRLQRLRGRQRRARPVGGELRVRLAGVRPARRGGGALPRAAVVAISSTSGVDTLPPARPNSYAAFKAAVIQHAPSLGHALAPQGIRVNTVSPGPIFFEGGPWDLRMQSDPEGTVAIRDRITIGRFGTPTDVANAVTFLASPAAGFLTGDNLVVDGGFTSRVQF